ncbi:hypothetical protein DFH28DRAFT_1194139 [Melampsora americana]|nr:hypothetical protein DFH28DRAFT_1194139 [Melampsora americana]
MYSNDTSSSHSKRFNKYMCNYFMYSKLPAKLAKLEYNIHWLAASTTAHALELGNNIVDQLNHLSHKGLVAYDSGIQKDVLLVAVQLAHLGDSPMHAEISNFSNPGTSLNPCLGTGCSICSSDLIIPKSQLPTLDASWKAFNVTGLHVHQMQPNRLVNSFLSLTGKEFYIAVQGAPFVLYEWLSVTHPGHMASMICNPEIQNMDEYCCKLDKHINNFLCSVISLNGNWVNKPKLHMLTHLKATIRSLRPAVLYMTESFESMNILTQTVSINSSCHDPGAHLAESFQNVVVTDHVFGGGLLCNAATQSWVKGLTARQQHERTGKFLMSHLHKIQEGVRCSMSVQHNCYDSQCKTVRSVQPIDQLSSRTLAPKGASLYNGHAHHE